MRMETLSRIPFPAVTICNSNPVPKSKLLCSNYDLATLDDENAGYE